MMAVDPFKIDPTRTSTLRRQFIMDMRRRFRELKRDIIELVLEEDAFGLVDRVPFTMNDFNPLQPRDRIGRWTSTGQVDDEGEKAIGEWTNDATKFRMMDEQDSDSPELKTLLNAVASYPRYDGLAYRGLVLNKDEADKLFNAKEFGLKGICSFAYRKNVAAEYADIHQTDYGDDAVGVIIRTRLQDARDIKNMSEVVTRRANFKIVSVLKMGETYLVTADQTN